jgi:dienelactone hydrolase
VLVWISPTPDGRIPDTIAPACDLLGLIAIGVDNNGNQREITDRLQNHLDSIETLAQHANIDRQRIYLTGMSGGGRCSGILQLAFPDYFAGAVPIVGLDTYHNAPTGQAGKFWPRRLSRPSGPIRKQLEDRRIRSITGNADFNEPEMTLRTQLLQDDDIEAQIDVIEGMAHTMPNPEHFTSALIWVDEPRHEGIEQSRNEAAAILKETQEQDASIPAVRRRLIEVLRLVPHTDQAWQAAERLGYPRTG